MIGWLFAMTIRKLLLPPNLIRGNRYRIRQIQATPWKRHGNSNPLHKHRLRRQLFPRQATTLPAEQKSRPRSIAGLSIEFCCLARKSIDPSGPHRRHISGEIIMQPNGRFLPIIHGHPLNLLLIPNKAQGADDMQHAMAIDAQTYDIPHILWNFRSHQH